MTEEVRTVNAKVMSYDEWLDFFDQVPTKERGVYFCVTADPHRYSYEETRLCKGDIGGKMHVFVVGDNRKSYFGVALTLNHTWAQVAEDNDLKGLFLIGYSGDALDQIKAAFITQKLDNVFDVIRPLCERRR